MDRAFALAHRRSVRAHALLDRRRVRGYSRPQVGALLRHWTGDGGALHLALVVHDHAGVVLEVDERAVLPSERLALPDHDGRHHLLSQLRFTLLDGRHEHVARCSGRHAVQSALVAVDADHVQVLGAGVIGTVDHGTDWQTQRDAELATGGTTTTLGCPRRSGVRIAFGSRSDRVRVRCSNCIRMAFGWHSDRLDCRCGVRLRRSRWFVRSSSFGQIVGGYQVVGVRSNRWQMVMSLEEREIGISQTSQTNRTQTKTRFHFAKALANEFEHWTG